MSVRVAVRPFLNLFAAYLLPLGVDCNLLASAAKNNAEAVIDALLL